MKPTLAVVMGVFVAWIALAQAQLGSRSRTPAAQFDSRDWTLLKNALREVLNDSGDAARREWHNETNGHGGTVRALKSYNDANGHPCKDVQIDSSAGGYTGSYRYGACLDAGMWIGNDGSAPLPASPPP